jgi:hypothetical protein
LFEREYVTLTDPEDDHVRYSFDVSFLLSTYHCIYGQGCQGVGEDGPDEVVGCCAHGAYVDDEDQALVRKQFRRLGPDIMQFHALARREGLFEEDDDEEVHTITHDGGCIFLNRAGFEGGSGCALHLLALREGERPLDTKPTVCWQLPLHRDIDEKVGNDGETVEVHTIGPYERGTWGEGGADFHWWCTEAPEAFVGRRLAYRTMEDELRAMVGDEVYEALADYLDRRRRQHNRVRFLPLVS